MARKSSSRKGHREMDLFDLMLQNDESAQVNLDYLVDTPEKAQSVLDKLIGAKYVSLDTEGTGLEPGPDDLSLDNDLALERVPGDLFAGFSFAISPTDAWYVPTRHYQARVLERKWVRALLDAILAIPRIRMHHAYHDLKVLWNFYGKEIYDRLHIRDSLVGCHTLFQSEEGADKTKRNQLGLKKLARQILNRDAGDFDSQWLGTKILRAPMADLAQYAREDAINTYLIGDWTDTETELQGTANYLETVGYPLIPVIAKAHYHGIAVNRDLLHTYRLQAAEKLDEMTCSLREAAGSDINPKSDRDMDRLIYDVLGMPQVGDRRDDGLRPLATEDLKDVLATVNLQKKLGIRGYDDEQVKYVEEYLEYQGLQKLYGSFILPLLEKSSRDGRIYPKLRQTGTVSGRFSSEDPNGQNMPSGRKADVAGLHLDIRAVFMPDPGCVFITLDEGALEVRVLAHFCQEPALVEALHLPKKQGGDPHQAAVDTIYKNTGIQITRDAAKTVQFGIIYGMSEHGLSLRLGISKAEARQLIEAYYAGMPHVRRWKEALELQIRRTGQVHSLLGRIRRTELHRHSNRAVVEGAIRSMINTQIQGSAADIINSAMVRTHYNEDFQRTGARMCLQVHDELLTVCPAATAERAMKIKSFYMRNPFPDFHLKVPLIVEGGISDRWEH